MSNGSIGPRDFVDHVIDQWRRERPDLDAHLMALPSRIRRASQIIDRRLEETWSRSGLGRGGFDVLAALRRAGPPYRLSPTELYSSLMISSGAMTNRIDRLEEAGLVIRQPDPGDRRGIFVGLTAEGLRLVDEVVGTVLDAYRELFAALTEEECGDLGSLLRKLLLAMGSEATPPMPSDAEGVGTPR
jgi:DNA-binding MarR family transcriptional regulator